MKKIKTPMLTLIVMASSFLTAYALTPEEVNCSPASQMFGESECTDADGNKRICKHTFWIEHSCRNYYGGTIPEEDPTIEP